MKGTDSALEEDGKFLRLPSETQAVANQTLREVLINPNFRNQNAKSIAKRIKSAFIELYTK